MNMNRRMAGVFAATMLLAASSLALGADARKPDGTVSIDETQFAVLVGGSWGGGKLSYQGKDYDFKLSGLTAGANVGASKMSAAGEVYDLKDISKFPGTYTKFDASATLGGGAGAIHMKNENGVIMKLTSRTQGLQLNIGSANGVKVTMK
jgi:hypothetical protein